MNDAPSHDLTRPDDWRGVILASPHSGRDYPGWFVAESGLDTRELRSSEDAFVDRLIAPAAAAGAAVLTARIPRCVVDLNRPADALDPAAIEGVLQRRPDRRIISGLGVIPRVVAQGRPIRSGKLTATEAARRIDAYWRPYHATLDALMTDAVARTGRAILIDVHSMPREALAHLACPRPEIVIGDRNGVSADRALSARVAQIVADAGFRVRLNSPFAGAYIAAHYGRPAQSRHVVQLEIDRSLYMDEAAVRPHDGYDEFARRFAGLVQRLARLGDSRAALAAE